MERFRRIASPRNASHFGELQLLDLKVEVPASRLVVEDPKAVKHGAILEIFFVQFEGHRRLIQRGRDESLFWMIVDRPLMPCTHLQARRDRSPHCVPCLFACRIPA